MAFVLDVNLRIKEILGLKKVEAALNKTQGTLQAGIGGSGGSTGGTNSMVTSTKALAAAAATSAVAINKTTKATQKLNAVQGKTAVGLQKSSNSIKDAGKQADTFGHKIKLAGTRYAAFLAATAGPIAVIGAFGKATAAVIEFDSAMLKMRQITGETEQQISGMRDNILDFAASTGTSASELARVGKVLAQAGQRGDQLTESLSALSKVPLTPSFETMDAAIEGTIAAINQFNSEGLKTTEVLDVMTALSNKFAASSEDIAKGTARGGAAFEAIGGTFKEFAAVFTTVRQATRESAETVGTFMKTISSRLADPKIVSFLEGKGINIGEAIEAGDPVGAMKRIAAALEDITSVQDKIEIGTKLGGRRQISRLLALVSNMDVLNDALKTAGTSGGAFGEVAEKGLSGLQAQINIMVQEWNKLIQALAAPVFVPLIKFATSAGKALAAMVDFAKPVIPALTYIAGFAGSFKLLTISITNAGKALSFMSKVGKTVGGGLNNAAVGLRGVADSAGGRAGSTARERVKNRLAGGVGLAAGQAAGGFGARAATGLKAAAASPITQLAGAAALALGANKASEAFEKAGNSAGVFAAEAIQAASVLAIAVSALSGKSIVSAFASLGPFGGAIAGATLAIGALSYAANQAAEMDFQTAIDEASKKISELDFGRIAPGDSSGLQEAVGALGTEGLKGLQEAASKYEDDWYDFLASTPSRIGNLLSGEGLVTIDDAQAREILDTMVGSNPELLNEILRSAVEQFGVGDIESGLDQMLSESFGGNVQAAQQLRKVMITHLGGLEKIASSVEKVNLDAKISVLANAIEKASEDFRTLHIPAEISSQLGLLSDAVGNAARAIETNVTLFDQMSQVVGQDIGVARPGTDWSTSAVEEIARSGNMGDLLDLSNFSELEGFTTDMAQVGTALENFMKTMVQSKASADSLRSQLSDPAIDPFDIMEVYIDQFTEQYPEQIPPEAVAAFKASAAKLGQQLRDQIVDGAGVIQNADTFKEAFNSTLGKQKPLYSAAIEVYRTWLEAQSKQLNASLSGSELLVKSDVNTAELGSTVIESLQRSMSNVGMDLDLPGFDMFQDADGAMVELIKNGSAVDDVLSKYGESLKKHGELLRKEKEARDSGEGASKELIVSTRDAAREVLELQAALTLLAEIASRAPEAFTEQEKKQTELGYGGTTDPREKEEFDKLAKETSEQITRGRQLIESEVAVDIAQVLEEPADIFAQALRESADAVKSFTTALTQQDLDRGAKQLVTKTTPEGRQYTERQSAPPKDTSGESGINTKHLQSALFGGEIENVMETLLQSASQVAGGKVFGNLASGDTESATANQNLEKSLNEFSGFIYDIPKIIQDSGLDPAEVARVAAESLKEQAGAPGAKEIEHLGALNRTMGDLESSLRTMIERPDVARQPEQLMSQLTPAMQESLQNLSTSTQQPAAEAIDTPRVFEGLSVSASDISQAASETRMAADATNVATEGMKIASLDMKTGGTDILSASQSIGESVNQLQAISDIQREAVSGEQATMASQSEDGGGVREAMTNNTEAISSLGERMDAVVQAVDMQTQQEAEIAASSKESTLELPGLEENTSAISTNNEVAGKTQESMSGLNNGMDKIASAMEDGVGVDVSTMSEVKVNVEGVSAAAREFTAEFEAVAERVAKAEINMILQQLARSAGSPEAASTFESAIT